MLLYGVPQLFAEYALLSGYLGGIMASSSPLVLLNIGAVGGGVVNEVVMYSWELESGRTENKRNLSGWTYYNVIWKTMFSPYVFDSFISITGIFMNSLDSDMLNFCVVWNNLDIWFRNYFILPVVCCNLTFCNTIKKTTFYHYNFTKYSFFDFSNCCLNYEQIPFY